DAVALKQDLPDSLSLTGFRYSPPQLRKILQFLDRIDHPADELHRIVLRIPRDVVADRSEIGNGGVRPFHFHRERKRFFSSSCGTTRPSSAAWMPAAIFWRTYISCIRSSHVA